MPVARFFRAQIDEIRRDPALRAYGAVLGAVHALGYLYWSLVQPAAEIASARTSVVCWPFLQDCARYRVLGRGPLEAVLLVYLATGLLATMLFWRERLVGLAYGLLATASVLEIAVTFLDYRLRLNQHYMAAWVTLVFLLCPHKRVLLQWVIVAFYFWAGTLKLDSDWLSGAALYGKQPWLVPHALIVPGCWYVVVLELVLSFGLLSRRRWLRWLVFGQFALFHLASWGVVGFYYPLLAVGISAIFPLCWWWEGALERPRAAYALVAAFSALQLLSHAYPGDTAITGEGRWLALHMFDAAVTCEPSVRMGARKYAIRPHALPARIQCDPLVYLGFARAICEKNTGRRGFDDFELVLRSRHLRDPALHTVVDIPRFCASHTTYAAWRHNPWISPVSR